VRRRCQLDTSSTVTPNDAKWTVRAVVCEAACTRSVIIYATHCLGTGVDGLLPYDKQLHQTLDFMAQGASKPPLLGDLNTFDNEAGCHSVAVTRAVRDEQRSGYV
jgi:hypothetical protein